MNDDKIYLYSILENIEKIQFYKTHASPKEAMRDAIIYNIATLGEAATKISAELKAKYKNVPWRRIIDCRNILIHNYLGIEEDIVWEIVEKHLPVFQDDIEEILKDLESKNG